MKQTETKPLQIRVPLDIHRELKVICAREDMSQAEFVIKCVTEYYKNKGENFHV